MITVDDNNCVTFSTIVLAYDFTQTQSNTEHFARWPRGTLTPGMKFAYDRRLEATLNVETPRLAIVEIATPQCTADYCRLIAFLHLLAITSSLCPVARFTSPCDAVHIRHPMLHECRPWSTYTCAIYIVHHPPSLSLSCAHRGGSIRCNAQRTIPEIGWRDSDDAVARVTMLN